MGQLRRLQKAYGGSKAYEEAMTLPYGRTRIFKKKTEQKRKKGALRRSSKKPGDLSRFLSFLRSK